MATNVVPPVVAQMIPSAGSAPLIRGECATFAQVAYGAVTADAFFDVARRLDPDEKYFFAHDQWRPPSATVHTVRAAADHFGVAREPLALTWAASMRERVASQTIGVQPNERALRLWETAAILLYNEPRVERTSLIEAGAWEYVNAMRDALLDDRGWHFLLASMSYARAALLWRAKEVKGMTELEKMAELKEKEEMCSICLECMGRSALELVGEWHACDRAAIEVVRELCGMIEYTVANAR